MADVEWEDAAQTAADNTADGATASPFDTIEATVEHAGLEMANGAEAARSSPAGSGAQSPEREGVLTIEAPAEPGSPKQKKKRRRTGPKVSVETRIGATEAHKVGNAHILPNLTSVVDSHRPISWR